MSPSATRSAATLRFCLGVIMWVSPFRDPSGPVSVCRPSVRAGPPESVRPGKSRVTTVADRRGSVAPRREMDFRILGSFEVADGNRTLVIGGGRQSKLLAILLLHANEFVGSDRLIDQVWGEQRPETAAKALQGYISQLRKLLGQEVLLTRPSGYVLRLAAGELDAERFERLVEQARDAEPRAAAEKLREALALWRGPALADFAYDDFARTEIER